MIYHALRFSPSAPCLDFNILLHKIHIGGPAALLFAAADDFLADGFDLLRL